MALCQLIAVSILTGFFVSVAFCTVAVIGTLRGH